MKETLFSFHLKNFRYPIKISQCMCSGAPDDFHLLQLKTGYLISKNSPNMPKIMQINGQNMQLNMQ